MAQSMWEKYAGKKIACTTDGYLGKFEATLEFPTDVSNTQAVIGRRDAAGTQIVMPVSVHVAIGRCEGSIPYGEKPNFYYS